MKKDKKGCCSSFQLNDKQQPFFITYFRAIALEVPYKMNIKDQTLTEGTEQTKEAKRSPLSTDFPIARWDSKKSGDNSDPKLFCHRSDSVNRTLFILYE